MSVHNHNHHHYLLSISSWIRRIRYVPCTCGQSFKLRASPFFTALGIYSTWTQLNACQELANSMQDEALRVAEERDEMEEVKATEIDPLWESVQTEVR